MVNKKLTNLTSTACRDVFMIVFNMTLNNFDNCETIPKHFSLHQQQGPLLRHVTMSSVFRYMSCFRTRTSKHPVSKQRFVNSNTFFEMEWVPGRGLAYRQVSLFDWVRNFVQWGIKVGEKKRREIQIGTFAGLGSFQVFIIGGWSGLKVEPPLVAWR